MSLRAGNPTLSPRDHEDVQEIGIVSSGTAGSMAIPGAMSAVTAASHFYGGSTGTSFSRPTDQTVREKMIASHRRTVAQTFARMAANFPGTTEVWLEEVVPDLRLAVILREPDLEMELGLQGLFIDVMGAELDPAVGELSIFGVSTAPEWLREGERL